MKKLYRVSVRIEQADWLTDLYGNPEVEPRSIRMAVIMAYRAAGDYGLRDAKHHADVHYTKVTGSTYLEFLGGVEMVGRLAALEYDRDRAIRENNPDITSIKVVDVTELSKSSKAHFVGDES